MAARRIALVAGSTGLTGGHLLTQLLKDDRYLRIISLVRKASPTTNRNHLQQVVDFNKLPALSKADDAYCCLGTTIKKAGSQAAFRKVDFEFVLNFALAAKNAGARRFLVVSSIGANARSNIFYSRIKGEMENASHEIGFGALHIFQPSLILGERKEQRAVESLGIAIFNVMGVAMLGPMRKYRPINSTTIAKAMIEAAFSDSVGTNTYQSDAIENLSSSSLL